MSAQQKIQEHPVYKQAQNNASYYVSQLDKELGKYPIMNNIEQRSQVPKAYVFIGGVALALLLHTVNALAAPVSNLIGWGLPAYLSFKAIESPGHEDDVQWLTYWIVFGFFNFLEGFAISLVLYYLPWYYAFKSVFILWLQLPAFRGAQKTYFTVLKPVLANISHQSSHISNDTTAPVTSQ